MPGEEVGKLREQVEKLEEKVRPPNGSAAVHFVVNCASLSCPPLADTAYTGENWSKMLDAQTKAYLKRDVTVDANAAPGIVDTIEQLDEALAPRHESRDTGPIAPPRMKGAATSPWLAPQ